jgi:hypothetical protein
MRHKALIDLLRDLWLYPMTTKSDYARLHADIISEAAVKGLITTQAKPGVSPMVYGREWRVTPAGLIMLWELN